MRPPEPTKGRAMERLSIRYPPTVGAVAWEAIMDKLLRPMAADSSPGSTISVMRERLL